MATGISWLVLWTGLATCAYSLMSPSDDRLSVFQVYKPIKLPLQGPETCQVTLMDNYIFGNSYGRPFVGHYDPPRCSFNAVSMNLTVTSKGRQFDRLASMSIGAVEVFRTSTAEPTKEGIIWTYIKDMTPFNALWQEHQTVFFELGNLVNDIYTASFNTTLTLTFWQKDQAERTADLILPIKSQNDFVSQQGRAVAHRSGAASVQTLPKVVDRATVSIAACGQIGEEFWYSNVLSSHTETFANTTGSLGGASPFREVQLLIDGMLAGVVWPFPVIFTGGLAPGLWRPMVGLDAFDLKEAEVDITPFVPLLSDGQSHTFELKVLGLDDHSNGTLSLTEDIGDYWVVSGKIFVYLGNRKWPINHLAPNFTEEVRDFSASSKINKVSGRDRNASLEYSVTARRKFTIRSAYGDWTQELAFQNLGHLMNFGFTQNNSQISRGYSKASRNGQSLEKEFSFPFHVETTFHTFPENGFSIDAAIEYGQTLAVNNLRKISHSKRNKQVVLAQNGPEHFADHDLEVGVESSSSRATVSGTASFISKANGSSSFGSTNQAFRTSRNGAIDYFRVVEAVNGSVRFDWSKAEDQSAVGPSVQFGRSSLCLDELSDKGRKSVKALIGRGP